MRDLPSTTTSSLKSSNAFRPIPAPFFLTHDGGDLWAWTPLPPQFGRRNEQPGVLHTRDGAEELIGLLRGPGERVEHIAALPRDPPSAGRTWRRVNGGEQLEERGFVLRSAVFLKRLAERELTESPGLDSPEA